MYLIDRSNPVASWQWLLDPLSGPATPEALHNHLEHAITLVGVLARHNLLHPSALIFESWLQNRTGGGLGAAVHPAMVLVLTDPQKTPLQDQIDAWFDAWSAQRGRAIPGRATFLGHGIAIDERGESLTQPDVMWLACNTRPDRDFVLGTQIDCWMSHTLDGIHQPNVQRANAPRLAAALAELSVLLDGIEADPLDGLTKQSAIGVENWGHPDEVEVPRDLKRMMDRARRIGEEERSLMDASAQ